MKIKEIKNNQSGIYKVVFNNNKIYIGKSANIKARMLQHINKDLKEHPELLFSKAYLKYGIKDIEIIEIVEDINLLSEKEKYYIKKYNSFLDRNIGYNMTPGGDGAAWGCHNAQSNLTEEDLNNIVKDLKENILTIEEIAQKYNSKDFIISRINVGRHYYNPEIEYPIRKNRIINFGLKNKQSAFYGREEDLEELISDLKNDILSYSQLKEKYNIKTTTLSLINQGKYARKENETYPLRQVDKGKATRRIFTEDEMSYIKQSLEKDISMAKIAKSLNCDRKVISDINKGLRQKQANWSYPLRKNALKTGPKNLKPEPVSTILESEE